MLIVFQVREIKLEYTKCFEDAPSYSSGFGSMPNDLVSISFGNGSTNAEWSMEKAVNVTIPNTGGVRVETNRCRLRFTIPEKMSPPVLFYYHLTNFYQNHRRYVDSFDSAQLSGDARSYDQIRSSDCTPLYGDGDDKKPYYPCGLIANSMFNDTFNNPVLLNPANGEGNETQTFVMSNNSNIAWGSDKDLYGKTKYKYDAILPPPNWQKRYPDNYTEDNPPPNLKEWEAFQVWMRTAGLPTFSKLYQRNDSTAMEPGRYEIIIDDREFSCVWLTALLLTRCRFQCDPLQGHQVHHHQYPHCHGRT